MVAFCHTQKNGRRKKDGPTCSRAYGDDFRITMLVSFLALGDRLVSIKSPNTYVTMVLVSSLVTNWFLFLVSIKHSLLEFNMVRKWLMVEN